MTRETNVKRNAMAEKKVAFINLEMISLRGTCRISDAGVQR